MGNFFSSKPVVMNTEVFEIVKNYISSDFVVIFSKSYCPYCKMAKEVFDKIDQKYTAIELDDREDTSNIQDVLLNMTGARSVPRVFIDGNCVGGGTDVKALHQSGKLVEMLKK